MNGVSVYPGQKTQNAPTWQVEKQAGRSVIFTIFNLLPPTSKPCKVDHYYTPFHYHNSYSLVRIKVLVDSVCW